MDKQSLGNMDNTEPAVDPAMDTACEIATEACADSEIPANKEIEHVISMVTDPQPGFSGIHRTLTHASCSLSFGSNNGDDRVCRICWMGEEKEACVRPCRCSGSSANVHPHCLRKWLQIANDYHCEICQFKYHTKVRMKPVSQWRWRPYKSRALSQLEATLILLGIVTPPLICGIILCTQKVIEYIDAPDHAWKIAALMTLVMASAGTYLAALVYFFRMAYGVGQEWLARNRQTTVRVGELEVVVEMDSNSNNSNGSTPQVPQQQQQQQQQSTATEPAPNANTTNSSPDTNSSSNQQSGPSVWSIT